MDMSIWKPIPDYEGIYEYDQFGNVKSLGRKVKNGLGSFREIKPTIKMYVINNGYYYIHLIKNNKPKSFKRNRLVWQYHYGKIPEKYEVHHKDENTTNDNILNLELVYFRLHRSKHKSSVTHSKYVGVSWDVKSNKWKSSISQKGVLYNLGRYNSEEKAYAAYKLALNKINNGGILCKKNIQPKGTVYFSASHKKWICRFKGKYVGIHLSQSDAKNALDAHVKLHFQN